MCVSCLVYVMCVSCVWSMSCVFPVFGLCLVCFLIIFWSCVFPDYFLCFFCVFSCVWSMSCVFPVYFLVLVLFFFCFSLVFFLRFFWFFFPRACYLSLWLVLCSFFLCQVFVMCVSCLFSGLGLVFCLFFSVFFLCFSCFFCVFPVFLFFVLRACYLSFWLVLFSFFSVLLPFEGLMLCLGFFLTHMHSAAGQ